MNEKEIMIGDWVRYRYKKNGEEIVRNFQVDHLDRLGRAIYVWGKELGNVGRVNKIEPIPLTTEILEKNGFAPDDFSPYLLPVRNGVIRFSEHQYGLYCQIFLTFQKYCGVCNYIHQLQHAMRLCGIEKEITL